MNTNEADIITSEDTSLAAITHISAFSGVLIPFGNIIAPFIIYLMKRNESEFVKEHALEVMNFQITFSLSMMLCTILFMTVIGIPFAIVGWAVLSIACLILTIMGAIKASDGKRFEYPWSLRLIK